MAVDPITQQAIYPGSPGVGLNHAGAYQASGAPYLTASTITAEANFGTVVRFDFPRIAKSVTVKVIPHILAGAQGLSSEPVTVFFGEPVDAAGNRRVGSDVYQTNGTNAPLQYIQKHGYTLSLISGSSNGIRQGEEITFGIKTNHINLSVNGYGGSAATGSFQIYAELTNIPAGRMSTDYISGSGVNIY